jgi:hypothetical protein|tara:strand:+ start:70 stop:588 length:519 start_codon:yes stop_codon:yes gene_type:complete
MPVDHLNIVERKLIDNLRTGTYNTTGGTSTAWSSSDVTVFGQFPSTTDVKYPAIVTEMSANGLETQFMGQKLTFGASNTEAVGELYGVAFRINIAVDRASTITVSGEPYKERRLLNYLMLNCANVLMDTDFSSTNTDVVQRNYTGFQDIGYNPDLEIWAATANMIIVFKNNR